LLISVKYEIYASLIPNSTETLRTGAEENAEQAYDACSAGFVGKRQYR
jgi:hypothetical protein